VGNTLSAWSFQYPHHSKGYQTVVWKDQALSVLPTGQLRLPTGGHRPPSSSPCQRVTGTLIVSRSNPQGEKRAMSSSSHPNTPAESERAYCPVYRRRPQ